MQIPGEGTYTVNAYQWSQPTQVTLPGGGKRQWGYDGFLRPTQLSGLDPAQNAVQQDGYTYNAVDNIIDRSTLNDSYQYGYDVVDRLLSVQIDEIDTTAYTYDSVGNRQTESGYTDSEDNPYAWEYDDNDRLTQRGPISYEYDANGSLIKKTNTETNEETRYTYNLENRLTAVRGQSNSLIASYSYDPFGRRVSKTIGGTTTTYLYTDDGLIAEAGATGTVTTSYLYNTNETWGTNPLLIRQSGMVGYYHNDHLGTPQVITAKSGAILWSASYTAFGKATVTTNTITNNLRFPGQYYDNETQTHYNYFRDYDPETGRYLQSDQLGLFDGPNTYAYVYSNPLIFADPTGEFGVAGAIGGGAFNFLLQFSTNLYLTNGDVGRSLRCINLTDVLVSAAVGAVAPSLLSNVVRGKAGPAGLTQGQNAYIYLTKAVPVGFALKKGIPNVRPSDFGGEGCGNEDDCTALKLTNVLSKIIQ